jgi:hypothetical protein
MWRLINPLKKNEGIFRRAILYSMGVGRPTKYDPKFIDKIDEYLATTGREQTELPTIEGFALYIDVSRDSIYEWMKEYKEFSDTIKKLEDKQKNQLINDGLYGGKEVNPGMAIFLLKANHKLIETSHTDITSGGQPIPILSNVSSNNGNSQAPETK